MIHIPYKIQPSNVEPFDVREVRCVDPRKRNTSMMVSIATFLYEEDGEFKAWTGVALNEVCNRCCILHRALKGKDSRVFNGYILPVNALRLALYELTTQDITVIAENLESVQNAVYDLTKTCARLQKQINDALKRKAKDEEVIARCNAQDKAEQRDVCDLVYPNRNGYQGD